LKPLIFNLDQPVDDFPQQQQQSIRKSTLPLYSDDYDNVPNVPLSNLSTPINQKQIPSASSSTSTTPVPSPEPHVPAQVERRRSISPPLPPQMSPDNGRPLQHLSQTNTQRFVDENIEALERSKSNSRAQVILHRKVFFIPLLSTPFRILLLIYYHHNSKDESKLDNLL
jgi:hypothetical protein